ncbi:MAG TPA: glycosyltransferase 61 family protein, partial [Acidimicrobiia bacterium]|nr:glycosyltransferase 61 family protein [Acidimicrobiia bacterium]
MRRGLMWVRRVVARILVPFMRARHGYWFVIRRRVVAISGLLAPDRDVVPALHAVSVAECVRSTPAPRLVVPDPGYPVLEMPGGVVFGPWGEVGRGDGVVLELGVRYGAASDRWVLGDCDLASAGPVHDLSGVTVNLVQRFATNYAHWLFQGLVRLEVLGRAIDLASCDRFLVPPSPPPFLAEVFERHGIDWARAEPVAGYPASYRCELLVAAGMPQRPWECPRWAMDSLRDRYGEPSADDGPRRVYLARGVGVRRGVVNEAELVAHLERRGFVTVSTIGRTIREQAALVGSAECIVAPLGAALGNLVFAPRTAHVIELAGRNFVRDTYRVVAATLGMPFTRLVGTEPGLPPWL